MENTIARTVTGVCRDHEEAAPHAVEYRDTEAPQRAENLFLELSGFEMQNRSNEVQRRFTERSHP